MAGDWIKMRTNLRRHPKVIAMSRHIASQRAFTDQFRSSQNVTHHENATNSVTQAVTLEMVARITVCGLLELWGAVNDVIKGDSLITYMTLSDLDDITGLPGFGEALKHVGWVTEINDESARGLVFPNFGEFNTPDAERKKAKSDAERAREYRARKKAEAENLQSHEPSQNVTENHELSRGEEKSRVENNKLKILNNNNAGELAEFSVERFKPTADDFDFCESHELDSPIEQITAEFRVHHGELGTRTTAASWSRLLRGWVRKRVIPPVAEVHR